MRLLPSADEPLDLRLVPGALAAWMVAWQGRLLPSRVLVVVGVSLALVATVLLVSRRGGRVLVVAAACGCAAASALVTSAHTGSRTAGPLHDLAAREAAVRVEAVLVDDPRRAQAPVRAGRPPLVVVRVRVEGLTAAGRTHRLRAPVVVLSSDVSWLALLPSQRVVVEGRLRPP